MVAFGSCRNSPGQRSPWALLFTPLLTLIGQQELYYGAPAYLQDHYGTFSAALPRVFCLRVKVVSRNNRASPQAPGLSEQATADPKASALGNISFSDSTRFPKPIQRLLLHGITFFYKKQETIWRRLGSYRCSPGMWEFFKIARADECHRLHTPSLPWDEWGFYQCAVAYMQCCCCAFLDTSPEMTLALNKRGKREE